MLKQIPVGIDDFQDLIDLNCYYVDKTRLLKKLFEEDAGTRVFLMTRPRRFGKTLTLSMCEHFLSRNKLEATDSISPKVLFKDTEIIKDTNFCEKYMGKCPTVFISLKSLEGLNYRAAYQALGTQISDLAIRNGFLLKSDKLTHLQKEKLQSLQDTKQLWDLDNQELVKSSLAIICDLLNCHYGKKVAVLIDEYDVPLQKATLGDNENPNSTNGYYSEMLDLIRGLLNNVFKSKGSVFKSIVTGCLRVCKESIFTGMNNLDVNTVLSQVQDYSQAIGFTENETNQMLDYYGLEQYKDLVKQYYDGYVFAKDSMYCPWDVVKFCKYARSMILHNDAENIIADNYWENSSSNEIINDFMEYIDSDDADRMQALYDGQTVKVTLKDNISYLDLNDHSPIAFWTILVHSGYLTIKANTNKTSDNQYEVLIPNEEIRSCFKEKILENFTQSNKIKNYAQDLCTAAISGNVEKMKTVLTDVLSGYVSVRDFAGRARKENYYHGLLNGLFANANAQLTEYKSNQESGDGYPDITFKAKQNPSVGVVIELKHTADVGTIEKCADDALINQIEAKHYADDFLIKSELKTIHCYSIVFYKKICVIRLKTIKD